MKLPVRSTLTLLAFLSAIAPASADDQAVETVTRMPGLVAFWTFGEEAGRPRLSTGTKERHPLTEVGGRIGRVEGGRSLGTRSS
jgi:hypothetical protein